MTSVKPFAIAIIGAGFSGTLMAVQLLAIGKQQSRQLKIYLIEKTDRLAHGTAYSTRSPLHLLNVPAEDMSAFPDKPQHFLDWAKQRDSSVTAETFVQRRVFGQYLAELLQTAAAEPGANTTLQLIRNQAIAVSLIDNGAQANILFKDGSALAADRVILALGNYPPANPSIANKPFYNSSRYLQDPWSEELLTMSKPSETVLLIGTGLTMIDTAMELDRLGNCQKMMAISRHGLLPNTHHLDVANLENISLTSQSPLKVAELFKSIRQEIDSVNQIPKGDWRSVINSLRSTTQTCWQMLPDGERRRFIRHLRHFWEVCRHRIAPEVSAYIDSLKAKAKLEIYAGHIEDFQEESDGVEVSIRQRARSCARSFRVDRVINCTGPECNFATLKEPLVESLRNQGLLRPDPLHIGIDIDQRGALLNKDGVPSRVFFTLGPPCKGLLWETVAVPEIRGQAKQLALDLLARVDKSSVSA